jgi:DNA-binding NarL/FixJ family response regulator
MAINLGIVDDKSINRKTIVEKLARYEEIDIVLEAEHGQDFLSKLANNEIHPDIVLMDLEMPVMDGIETIKKSSLIYPDIKFIILTVFEDNDKIFEAIKNGASGYLLKEDTAVNIIDAITNVYEHNGIPMSPAIARKVMQMMVNSTSTSTIESTAKEDHKLSVRELDILKELVSGKSYKAIGEKLFISPLTVRKHVANIYEKLHVSSRAEIVTMAHKNNWI